jgi:hypothetical protein
MSSTLKSFPPVPRWRPAFQQPIEEVVDRVRYYTNQKRDFAVFKNGTCAILEPGLTLPQAESAALETLSKIFRFHPDMQPLAMDDGNVLVRYNQPACNVVLEHVARAHWAEIDSRHLDALTADEVLITPAGPNKFDEFGKKALFGRCFMFMDALAPSILRIERASA